MTAPTFVAISNEPRDYAWGIPGGISRALGYPPVAAPEAELWLGAHPLSPSRAHDAPWADLAQWERQQGIRLPFLLKVLAAASPLSLQAHPTAAIASAGFAAEEAQQIPRAAGHRRYKDPYAKPELVVAVEDGFEALCGFRPADESLADLLALEALATDPAPFRPLIEALRGSAGVRAAFEWLVSGTAEVFSLTSAVVVAATARPERFELVLRLAAQYPGDAGIVISLLLNHVVLRAEECLWLPAGNIHAYLRGLGVELMGPSDNVLRGGLTGKHIDIDELVRVLDFSVRPVPFLPADRGTEHVAVYRPASLPTGRDVPFDLRVVEADAQLRTDGPAIGVVFDGEFVLRRGGEHRRVGRGEAVLVTSPGDLSIAGEGRLYLACGAA